VEREVLEDPQPDAVALGEPAVLAVGTVVHGLGVAGEPAAIEVPIDDRRDPPTRDRVLAKLEEAGAHGVRPRA